MIRRRWVCLGLAVAMAIGPGAWLFWPVSPAVRAYERIRLGMTREAVEAAIGKPALFEDAFAKLEGIAANHFGGALARCEGVSYGDLRLARMKQQTGGAKRYALGVWLVEEDEIQVAYDSDGRVVGYYLMGPCDASPAWLYRLRNWLGF